MMMIVIIVTFISMRRSEGMNKVEWLRVCRALELEVEDLIPALTLV